MDRENFIQSINNFDELADVYCSDIWRADPSIAKALKDRIEEIINNNEFKHVANVSKQIFSNIELALDYDINECEDEKWMLETEWLQKGGAKISNTDSYDINHFCNITEEFRQKFNKFSASGRAFVAEFKNLHEVDDIENLLLALFQHLVDMSNVATTDKIGFEIRHKALDTPILIPFQKKESVTVEHIVRTVSRVVQSNTELDLEDGLECQITKISPPSGSGWVRMTHDGDLDSFLQKHKSVISINSEDMLCLPRALVVSIAYADNDPKVKTIMNSKKYNLQKDLAIALMHNVGLADHIQPWGIEEVKVFQNFLTPEYQIKVFDKCNCESIIFDGPLASKQLYLFLNNSHFFVISKICAFLNTSYWCSACNKPYKNRNEHRICPVKCDRCFQPIICQLNHQMKCKDCNRWFANERCYKNHKDSVEPCQNNKKRKRLSICEMWRRCLDCGTEHYHTVKHSCSLVYCPTCHKEIVKSESHQCFMQKYIPKTLPTGSSFIFFDFETYQTECIEETQLGPVFLHKVICCIAHKVCDNCWTDNDMDIHCKQCGQRCHIFIGDDSLDLFVKWLFSENNRSCIAMAHNGKSYDFQFILERLHKNSVASPKLICRGLELLKLTLSGVTLLDSINFLPMALSAMPKAFNLKEMKKGFFPHLFSSPENLNYKGLKPDPFFYSPALMKHARKLEFFNWYFAHKNDTFHFKQEMIDYCNSDVDILKRACMKFRESFMMTNELDPFCNSITIADACIKIYRMSYLPEDTIGLIPYETYRIDKRYSVISIKWLRWLSKQKDIRIDHACNGKEFRIKIRNSRSIQVDGHYKNTVYEFHGCSFHGCLKCFRPNTFLPLTGKLVKEANQRTMDREQLIRNEGYDLVVLWECELKHQLRCDKEMRLFFSQQKLVEPMKARDSFFGGRTNCIKLYHKVKENERIEYIDLCSLYPYVLKYGIFPVGHPIIITENFTNLSHQTYTGLINCRVLPPKQLFHPVLPIRLRGKLLFPLCYTCAENIMPGACNHSEAERSFWGSWVTIELYKSMELGYKILEVSEVWHYPDCRQYNPNDNTAGGLFVEYINTFLKIKQEASDWPDWCNGDSNKQKYLEDYKNHEHIELDPDNIKKNPALRALSKLCLNSFFGKFGQRSNMPKSVYCHSPDKFFELMSDDTKVIKNLQFVSNHKVLVNYINADGFAETLPNTNVVIAAYVTAQARLKLYSYLEILQKQVLYFDTDSCVYISTADTPNIATGDHLGDMTNELAGYGKTAFINEWCSCGPKNYAYKVKCEENSDKSAYCVKIRGFTLDTITAKRLNLRTMKQKVFAFVKGNFCPTTDIITWKIDKTTERHVITHPKKKSYSLVVDKRYCTQDFTTYPFGY